MAERIEVFHQVRSEYDEERMWHPGYDGEGGEPPFPQRYRLVAVISTDNLDVAWEKTNHISHSWTENPEVEMKTEEPVRSSMVGDIFVKDGQKFVVAPVGFNSL